MSPEQAAELLDRYYTQTCTPAEQELVERFYAQLRSAGELEWNEGEKEQLGKEMELRLLEHVHRSLQPPVISMYPAKRKRIRWWMAAAIAGFVVAGGWVWLKSLQRRPAAAVVATIRPGGDKAILTLADGKQVVLDSAGNGTVAEERGMKITKVDGGLLTYKGLNGDSIGPAHETNGGSDLKGNTGDANSFNTLAVPRGGKFQVVLPDGTHVWLNSGSTLRYPTAFSGKARRVELTGEGYFDVKHDAARPFFVRSGETDVEALGTGFNLMAYDDEPGMKVTLVDGSVAVGKAADRVVIRPGEQAVLKDRKGRAVIGRPDLKEVLAWKDGDFRFDGTDIASIMRQVARWYDVNIAYSGTMPTNKFTGVIPRKSDVRELLTVLEVTGKVHFRQNGKTVTVISGPAQ